LTTLKYGFKEIQWMQLASDFFWDFHCYLVGVLFIILVSAAFCIDGIELSKEQDYLKKDCSQSK